jgi:iron complex outermembrane receptor protein
MLRALVICAIALGLSMLWPRAADAQQTAAAPVGAESGNSEMLAEVIVTSTKRAENLQKTDASITVLSENELQERNIFDPGQLNGLVPGVSIQPSFILLTYIRGLGNYSSQPGVDQSVAYNVDGIYITKPYGMPTILFDLGQVEMLRGPQGTLQGRNAVAGSIDLISARPSNDFESRVSLGLGNYHAVNTEGMVNIPLAEGYDLRISGATAEHEGYFGNGFGDQNVAGGRIRFLASPTPDFQALITGEYTQKNNKGETYSPCPPGSTAAQGCAGIAWNPWAGTPGQPSNNLLYSNNSAIYANISYNFNFATLTWIPNYRQWFYENNQSLSTAFGYAPAVKDKMHSEEVRLASNPGSRIAWVAGVSYALEWEPGEENYFTSEDVPNLTLNQPGFPPVENVYYKNDVYKYTYQSNAVFAHASVPLLVDKFRFVGGARYTVDKKFDAGNTGVLVPAPVTGAPVVSAVDTGGSLKTARWTYKAGLEFDVGSEKMLYANVSSGYKAGGVNGVPPGSNILPTFAPETITAYQAGFKSRWLDDRLQVNTEAFYYNYGGFQTSFFAVTSGGVLVGATTNSQKARLYGGEIEAAFLATPVDTVSLALTGLSAVYTEFVIPQNGSNLNGFQMQNAPPATVTANYSHTFKFANGASLVPHVEVHYEGGQWVDYRHSPGSYTAAHTRDSADMTYNLPNGHYLITAYVENFTNNDTLLVANAGLGPYDLGEPYPPRTFGLRFTAHM